MREPTIAAAFPKALLIFAVSRGADRDTLLDRSGIASQDLADPQGRIALSAYVALFSAAIDLCGDPALPLKFGEAVRMQDISIVGLVCEAAADTMEVGRQLNRYSRLVVDEGGPADMVRATPGREGVWMDVVSTTYASTPFIIEAELSRLVCNTRATFGGVPEFDSMTFPLAAHFTHDEPSHRAEYERIFGAPIVFGSDRNALLLDPRFPTLRQPRAGNRYVFGSLAERADALLRELEAADTTRARVERVLLPILHTGATTMDVLASKLGFSRRTLLRRLNSEGVTYEGVLDDLRRRLALGYLAGGKVSANQTAYLVGFSEPSAFTRAFRRWTGQSPREYASRSPDSS